MSLIQFLKTNEKARKIFGKRELKIIEKQINGISLTQSEKNRLSRDIRKKLEFIKEISRFESEFDLKKGAGNKKLIKEAIGVILDNEFKDKIKKILLFGSVVKNEVTIGSDIDIAVIFNNITLKDATRFRARVSGRLPDKVDIQVFNTLPKKIQTSILKNHKVLYEYDRNKGQNKG